MTLIELVQQVCDELMIDRPSVVVNSADPQIVQLYALLNRLGNDISRQSQWQRLNNEYVLTTQAITQSATAVDGSAVLTGIPDTSALSTQWGVLGPGMAPFAQIVSVDSPTQVTLNMVATQTGTFDIQFSQVQYPLPSDWLMQIHQTEWDRTNRWPLLGPKSPQEWQSFKSGIVYAGPRERFRILQNTIAINPPPPNGLMFSFEYISTGWVISNAGVRQSKYLADTDTSIFSDSLLITGLKSLWKAAKGLDASFDLGEFRVLLETNKSQDRSAPRLSLSPYGGSVLLTGYNIPDGSWPSQ